MRIAVCDDEQIACEQIVTMLEEYIHSSKKEIDYEVFSSYTALDNRLDDFDLFFVDYKMPEIDGLEFSHKIRKQYGDKKALIFITAYSEIVYDAFTVQAHRFLTKPLQKDKFFEALDAYFQSGKSTGHLVVQEGNTITAVDFDDICYIEVMRKELYICTEEEQILCHRSIASVEEGLEGCGFFRTHRSFIVNLKYIRTFDNKEIELKNGEKIPVSSRKYADLCKAYLQTE